MSNNEKGIQVIVMEHNHIGRTIATEILSHVLTHSGVIVVDETQKVVENKVFEKPPILIKQIIVAQHDDYIVTEHKGSKFIPGSNDRPWSKKRKR